MNKVVRYGLERKDLRVSGASWIKGTVSTWIIF